MGSGGYLILACPTRACVRCLLPCAGLQNNKLSGPLPSSMMFNQSFGINALSINENNFSGPVPSWPDQPNSILTIHPGNEGLCGTVRTLLPRTWGA